ncbi:Putative 3-demethylubiquinone-9 3-O-methyltransferase protein (fragment) [Rhizobium mesoamericanum STM3625]|uniref:Putative 3-demethylubiquinone-9 3-O-methyltransferase protein n=1 Tax=Rhizobium mesoamericanum STM3625 TaxID=1211777 RepID=K0PSH2_9HYPH
MEMIADPDRERAKRVTEVMLGMVKIDIVKLEAAYR